MLETRPGKPLFPLGTIGLMFKPLPSVPDHPALEREVLERWEEEQTFQRLREQNAGGPRFSFMDGPITANAPVGVHHGIGPDAEGRLPALQGRCAASTSATRTASTRRACTSRSRSRRRSGSTRSARSRSTGSPSSRAAAATSSPSTPASRRSSSSASASGWTGATTTSPSRTRTSSTSGASSRSASAASGSTRATARRSGARAAAPRSRSTSRRATRTTRELEHPSLYVRFPLREREGESLVVWTTTPWTLPANVAAAVKPDAEYGLRDGEWRLARGGRRVRQRRPGRGPRRARVRRPFDDLPAQDGRHPPRDPVGRGRLDEGTGIVHIAPGAGAEDFELSRVHGLPVLAPIDDAGRFVPGYGAVRGLSTDEVVEPVVEALERARAARRARHDRPPLPGLLALPHAARLPGRRRLVHLGRRDPPAAARRQRDRRVDAAAVRQADGRLAPQHGRLEHLPPPLLRAAAALLPLRLRAPERDRLARRARGARRAAGSSSSRSCTGRGSTTWRSAARSATGRWGGSRRSATPGSTPASSTSRRSAGRTRAWVEHGNATGAAAGLTGADLPDHAYWEQWFPADWVSEGRAQIRLWFYSQCFMAITLTAGSRTARCSPTRTSSTRPAARCTSRGATRSS